MPPTSKRPSKPSGSGAASKKQRVGDGKAVRPAKPQGGKASAAGSKRPREAAPAAPAKRSDKKIALREKKFSQNPSRAVVHDAKLLWEKLRMKALEKRHAKGSGARSQAPTDNEKVELCSQLLELMRAGGKGLKEVCLKHDGCRIVQSILKHGSAEHRAVISKELKGEAKRMAKDIYGQFLIRRLLKYGTKPQRDIIIREFYGYVGTLIKHKQASKVLEYIYADIANAEQRTHLLLEFYGPELTLFQDKTHTSVQQILAEHPDKQGSVIKNLAKTVNVCVAKGLLRHSIIHRALFDYLSLASATGVADSITNLCEHVAELCHTRDGSRAACIILAYSSAKDRKRIIKSLKGLVVEMAMGEFAHLVVCRLLDVVDDTVLVQKNILSELSGSMLDVCLHQHARKVILHLLSPSNGRYFCPSVLEIMQPFPKIAALSDSEAQNLLLTSKKDAEQRRKELLTHISPSLISLVETNAQALLSSKEGSEVLREIVLNITEDQSKVGQSVAEASTSKSASESQEDEEPSAGQVLLTDGRVSRLIKDVVKHCDAAHPFPQILLKKVKGSIKEFATDRFAAFVVVSLIEHASTAAATKAALKPHLAAVKSAEGPGQKLILSLL
eukprot:tig00000615_g2590.t1